MARTKQTARKSVGRKRTDRKAVFPAHQAPVAVLDPGLDAAEPGTLALKQLRAVVREVVSRTADTAAEQHSFAVGGACRGVPAIPGLAVKGHPTRNTSALCKI
jgi:hypothetical protein